MPNNLPRTNPEMLPVGVWRREPIDSSETSRAALRCGFAFLSWNSAPDPTV